jgi:predicted TIM-barrel fold metal-dependent hydrolase
MRRRFQFSPQRYHHSPCTDLPPDVPLGPHLSWARHGAEREAYNDWLAAYCAYAPTRMAGLALVSLYDPKAGAHELERCAKLGLKGAMIWCSPPTDQPYSSDVYDPF